MIASLRTIAARRRYALKRTVFLTLLCVALAITLAGCASNADGGPSPSAGMNTPSVSPMASNMPSATDNGILGELSDLGDAVGDTLTGNNRGRVITTAEDALTASKELRDAVQKLTEVDTAVAVVTGDTALVGVTFDASYQGSADDRLRGMVLDRARAIHPGIEKVAITSAADDISEISSLYQMLQSGSAFTTVKANADTLAARLDVFRK